MHNKDNDNFGKKRPVSCNSTFEIKIKIKNYPAHDMSNKLAIKLLDRIERLCEEQGAYIKINIQND